MFGKKSFSNPKCLNKYLALNLIKNLSTKSVGLLRKLFLKKCCKNSKIQAEACLETKTSQEKSCKCLTKILALNIKCCKKSLASKPKVYWKVLLLIQTDSRKVLLWKEKFLKLSFDEYKISERSIAFNSTVKTCALNSILFSKMFEKFVSLKPKGWKESLALKPKL